MKSNKFFLLSALFSVGLTVFNISDAMYQGKDRPAKRETGKDKVKRIFKNGLTGFAFGAGLLAAIHGLNNISTSSQGIKQAVMGIPSLLKTNGLRVFKTPEFFDIVALGLACGIYNTDKNDLGNLGKTRLIGGLAIFSLLNNSPKREFSLPSVFKTLGGIYFLNKGLEGADENLVSGKEKIDSIADIQAATALKKDDTIFNTLSVEMKEKIDKLLVRNKIESANLV